MSHSETHSVPLVALDSDTAAGLGTMISSIEEAEIEQRIWNPYGTRQVTSGGRGDTVEGPFDIYWLGEMMFSENNAVGRKDLLGWRVDPSLASEEKEPVDRNRLLVDEVNYHDDGGQAFLAPGIPTVFLLAPPGDDITPDKFVAIYSDGTRGMNMHPGTWHTAPLPLVERATYDNRQGSIHATVGVWARQEWGLLLDVPLVPA